MTKNTKYLIVSLVMAGAWQSGALAETIELSREQGSCLNIITKGDQTCQYQFDWEKCLLETSTSTVSPGSDAEILKNSDTLDNCSQNTAHTLKSNSYTWTEHNSVTITGSASLQIAYDTLKADLESSASTSDGSSVTVTVPSQDISVPPCAQKIVDSKEKKKVGQQLQATGTVTCYWTCTYAGPGQSCNAHTVGDEASSDPTTYQMGATVVAFYGGGVTAVKDGTCPPPPSPCPACSPSPGS